ncbi:MAG: hypothetical protein PHH47_08460 [Gallionella sp.]|nr:hypothetical protein [Gallionella sp.]MDD4945921.1 hypothetical protein [Gallionella sp.]MDD5611423.1 hypothetical protein [Gallionella sp.]
MNEEQAVLDFFSKQENLPLGLSVATLMDDIRKRMNNDFWQQLLTSLEASSHIKESHWLILTTEDRNDADQLVGLHFNLNSSQEVYLRPMIEQQFLGGNWRIYFGLVWSIAPSPEHLKLPAVARLKDALNQSGLKSNESFLGWQWTNFHPRRQDFLLRFSADPQSLLEDAAKPLLSLMSVFSDALAEANASLHSAPSSKAISLDQLRSKR